MEHIVRGRIGPETPQKSRSSAASFAPPAPARPSLDDTLGAVLSWVYEHAPMPARWLELPSQPHLPMLAGTGLRFDGELHAALEASAGRMLDRYDPDLAAAAPGRPRLHGSHRIQQLGREPWAKLELARCVRLDGFTTVEAAEHLRLTSPARSRWHAGSDRRHDGAERLLRAGDELWHRLGAWPWAAFSPGRRPLRWEWWREPEAGTSFASWASTGFYEPAAA